MQKYAGTLKVKKGEITEKSAFEYDKRWANEYFTKE